MHLPRVKRISHKSCILRAARALADVLDIDPRALASHAASDPHGGWDHGAGMFPKGCIWRVEGQMLYGLVRVLRPRRVADLGTHAGASATHLAAALQANGRGRLVSIDRGFGDILVAAGEAVLRERLADRMVIRSRNPWLLREARVRRWQTEEMAPPRRAVHYGGALRAYRGSRCVIELPGDLPLPAPGHLIPQALRPQCRLVIADAAGWLTATQGFDFIFEDLDHDRHGTARVARVIRRRLAPGGVLVCHDALHPRYGAHVRLGLADAGLHPIHCVQVGRSDCGLGVWKKPWTAG